MNERPNAGNNNSRFAKMRFKPSEKMVDFQLQCSISNESME